MSCSVFHSPADGGLSIPRIIINQLKWLDRVVDSKVVISVMMGLVVCAAQTLIKVLIYSITPHGQSSLISRCRCARLLYCPLCDLCGFTGAGDEAHGAGVSSTSGGPA